MKRVKINKLLFVLALLALFLTQGCVGFDEELIENSAINLKSGAKPFVKEEIIIARVDEPLELKKGRAGLTNFVNDAWLGDETQLSRRGKSYLPTRVSRFHDLTFITPAMNLNQIADTLARQIETPIQVLSPSAKNIKLAGKKSIRFKGKIRDLLDLLATSFDAVWHYDRYKHRIIFKRVLTRELNFFAGAGQEQFIKKIATEKGSASSFSSNSQVVFNPWHELKNDLEKLLPAGSRISLAPTSGNIVLTTTPSALRAAVKLIAKRNRFLQKQIYFNVQLIELTIPEEKIGRGNLPLSLSSLLKQASSGRLIIENKTALKENAAARAPASGQKQKNAAPIKAPPSAEVIEGKSSIEIVLEVLDRIGNLSVVSSTNSWTRNGKAIPVRKTSQHAYVAQVKGGEFIPAQLETSFYLHLVPLILPRARIQVDLSVALKSLNKMQSYGEGDNQIQLPQLSTKTWSQEAIIPNGATLLLSGFEVRRAANNSHVMMIILITPQVQDS